MLSLVNRGQIGPKDFETDPSDAVSLTEDARLTLLVAYQERKREEVTHPFTGEKIPTDLEEPLIL